MLWVSIHPPILPGRKFSCHGTSSQPRTQSESLGSAMSSHPRRNQPHASESRLRGSVRARVMAPLSGDVPPDRGREPMLCDRVQASSSLPDLIWQPALQRWGWGESIGPWLESSILFRTTFNHTPRPPAPPPSLLAPMGHAWNGRIGGRQPRERAVLALPDTAVS